MLIIEDIVTDELGVTKHLPFVPCPMATVQQIVFNVFVHNVGLRYWSLLHPEVNSPISGIS
jgi:hypothetical protein